MHKKIILKYLASLILFLSSCGISTYKIPLLIDWNFNVFPLQIFYILFFFALIKLIFNFYDAITKLLIHTLPTEIVLILVITLTDAFQTHVLHWLFTALASWWMLLLTIHVIHLYTIKHTKKNSAKKFIKRRKSLLIFSVLGTVIITHFIFGIYHLNKSAYVDERLWTYSDTKRIEKYWANVIEMDWYNTRPSDKPGISLTFISGPSLLFTTPSELKKANNPSLEKLMRMLFIMRLPLLIFSTIILFVFYHVIKTTFDIKTGLIAVVFIGLSPILLGASRLINPDALSWSIIPLTILSFFAYHKTKKIQWLYFTGFLLGWSLLTKYIANILFLFFLLFSFTRFLFYEKFNRELLGKKIREQLSSLFIISLISILTFYVFYPGAWVKPERLLLGTIWSQPFIPIWKYFTIFVIFLTIDYFINKSIITIWIVKLLHTLRKFIIPIIPIIFFLSILIAFYSSYFLQNFIDFESILSSPKTSIREGGLLLNFKALITSFYILIFGISPIAIGGIFFTVKFLLQHYSQKHKSVIPLSSNLNILVVWHLLLFIIFFYVTSIFSTTVPIVRYQIIIYPLMFVIISWGWKQLFNKKNTTLFHIFIIITITTSSISLYLLRPYYFNYNSMLLPKKQLINVKDMGDGIYEAAVFLNTLPNAKKLNIWSDRKIICSLFIGECTNVTKLKKFIEAGPNYDYYVISSGHKHKTTQLITQHLNTNSSYPLRLDRLYTENYPTIFKLFPGNRINQYIKIIENTKDLNILTK